MKEKKIKAKQEWEPVAAITIIFCSDRMIVMKYQSFPKKSMGGFLWQLEFLGVVSWFRFSAESFGPSRSAC